MIERFDTVFLTQEGTYIKGWSDMENWESKSYYVDLRAHPYFKGIEVLPEIKDKLIEYKYGRNYPPPIIENK